MGNESLHQNTPGCYRLSEACIEHANWCSIEGWWRWHCLSWRCVTHAINILQRLLPRFYIPGYRCQILPCICVNRSSLTGISQGEASSRETRLEKNILRRATVVSQAEDTLSLPIFCSELTISLISRNAHRLDLGHACARVSIPRGAECDRENQRGLKWTDPPLLCRNVAISGSLPEGATSILRTSDCASTGNLLPDWWHQEHTSFSERELLLYPEKNITH